MMSKPKVFVGMSGGVDSSVSAALLKEQGYLVVGVFIKAWEPFDFAQGRPFDCGWRDERRDAMRVAAKLQIPFVTLDLSEQYKKEVVDYMIREYQSGRTPNPDVMCNKTIKFGAFYKKAREAGADYVATGHYARVRAIKNENLKIYNGDPIVIPAEAGIQGFYQKHQLLAGVDNNKDQSYFLWTLTQEQLAHTLFPIGDLEKSEVRKLAKKYSLPTATKKDSQGLCFVGKLDLKEFLRSYIDRKPGDVLDEAGKIIGRHEGSLLYTLGERHGFEIFDKKPDERPLYVVSKNVEGNTITVGGNPEINKYTMRNVKLEQINFCAEPPKPEKLYSARIRYRQPLEQCYIKIIQGGICVVFEAPQLAAPGQSLALYDGDICLGGGVIS